MKGAHVRFFVIAFSCLCLCSCNHRSAIYSHKTNLTKQQLNRESVDDTVVHMQESRSLCLNTPASCPPAITIWIYGTLLLKKSFFYKHFNGETGLKVASDLMKKPKCPGKIAFLMAEKNPIHFPLETFYFFGWTGKLDEDERIRASRCLLKNIQHMVKQYRETYGVDPKITIISHSHGGNIALHLPSVVEGHQEKPIIDTLVLLACPVQRKTMPHIYDPMFKKIYALYSSLDMIQILAPQHPYYKPFSSKQFPKSEKMVQARIKINGHALLHTSFSKKQFMGILPIILDELKLVHEKMHSDTLLAAKEVVMNIRM